MMQGKMWSWSKLILLGAWLPLAAGGCGERAAIAPAATETPSVAAAAQAEPALEPLEDVEAEPAHRYGQFYVAAEPTPEDLARFQALGVRTVVDLRMPRELAWDEPAAAEALGMEYVSIPFAGPETLTDELLETALATLADEDRWPILVHCATSNRTGAIWYAHRIVNDGLERDAALEEAKTVGLRTMGFVEVVDDFFDRAARAEEHRNDGLGAKWPLEGFELSVY